MPPADQKPRTLDVAVIGNRDNGKSTFINALLGFEITEAGETDCTRGIQKFNLKYENTATATAAAATTAATAVVDDDPAAIVATATNAATIRAAILEAVKMINNAPRMTQDQQPAIQVHTFDVPLDSELVTMHHDLQLVLSDYPGFDEDLLYKEHFKSTANTSKQHDMIILVLDSMVANKPESFGQDGSQRNLLKLVKQYAHQDNTGDAADGVDDTATPIHEPAPTVLIVVNKVDDPYDKDTKKRVAKVAEVIEEVFPTNSSPPPLVVELSAKRAFKYRSMASMATIEQVAQLPQEEIRSYAVEGCGRAEIARMSDDELAQKVFEISRDASAEYKSCLESTGFLSIQKTVQTCLGGPKQQGSFVARQLRSELLDSFKNAVTESAVTDNTADDGSNRNNPVAAENDDAQAGGHAETTYLISMVNDVEMEEVEAKSKSKQPDGLAGYTTKIVDSLNKQAIYSDDMAAKSNFAIVRRFHDDYFERTMDAFANDPKSVEALISCFEALRDVRRLIIPILSGHEDDDKDKFGVADKIVDTNSFIKTMETWVMDEMIKILREEVAIIEKAVAKCPDERREDCHISLLSLIEELDGSFLCKAFSKERRSITAIADKFGPNGVNPKGGSKTKDLGWSKVANRVNQFLAEKADEESTRKMSVQAGYHSAVRMKAFEKKFQAHVDRIDAKLDTIISLLNEKKRGRDVIDGDVESGAIVAAEIEPPAKRTAIEKKQNAEEGEDKEEDNSMQMSIFTNQTSR